MKTTKFFFAYYKFNYELIILQNEGLRLKTSKNFYLTKKVLVHFSHLMKSNLYFENEDKLRNGNFERDKITSEPNK